MILIVQWFLYLHCYLGRRMLKTFSDSGNSKRREMFAYISLFFCMITYGASFLAMKVVLFEYSPATMMMFRMLIASIMFIPFMTTVYRNIRIQKKDIGLLLLMTICEPCLYFLFEANALSFTTSSQAGIVYSMLPLFITLGAIIVLREKVPLAAFGGFLIAIIGSILLSCNSAATEIAPRPLLGNSLEFLAVIMTTVSIITTKYLMDKYPPFFLAGFQTLSGAVFFTILNFVQGHGFHLNMSMTLFVIIYLGIVTVSDYALYNFAMCTLSASKASAFLYLQPVFAIFFGVVFLNEFLTPLQIFAVFLIFTGLILSQKKMLVKARRIARGLRHSIRNDIGSIKINK